MEPILSVYYGKICILIFIVENISKLTFTMLTILSVGLSAK